MNFWNKSKKSEEEMQNWYQDRYVSIAIQRNFLLLFSVFTSLALLICLIIVKHLQEGKISDPYLVEYDKKSGYMTVVEAKSKKEYTAQQAVKESMVLQYINKREAPQLSTIEEDMNYIRVTTASKIYRNYLTEVGNNIKALRSAGLNPKYEVKVKTLQYLAANRMQLTITKNKIVDDKQVSSDDYNIVIAFGFADAEMPIDDMRINPLGFQVTYYYVNEIKTFKSSLVNNDTEDKKDQQNDQPKDK